ncbi:MAG: DUF308 domain-containing protein [Clostridia bacterium]|nr:DUF308 domain-containing protein [Clostridia bacterium]
MASKKISNNFLMAILYVVVGALLCIFKAEVLNWVMTAAGVLFVVAGVLDIVKYKNNQSGIVNIVIGAVIIIAGWFILEIALIVFGVLIVINGVNQLVAISKTKKLLAFLAPVVTILVGVLLAIAHWVVFDWFFIVVGVIFIVDGVLQLIGAK